MNGYKTARVFITVKKFALVRRVGKMGKILKTYKIPVETFEALRSQIDAVDGRYFLMDGIRYRYVSVIGDDNNKKLKELALEADVDISEFDINRQSGGNI